MKKQRGGTLLGFILGALAGLGVALALAVYITKVPMPFSNKNQSRSAEQDAVEAQKNKDWNPNSVLQPKAPAELPVAPSASQANASAAALKPSLDATKSVSHFNLMIEARVASTIIATTP